MLSFGPSTGGPGAVTRTAKVSEISVPLWQRKSIKSYSRIAAAESTLRMLAVDAFIAVSDPTYEPAADGGSGVWYALGGD